MNEGLQKLQVPEFKDKLFYHYYYWEFYSLELFTWTHNIAFETFTLNLGCLFELRCASSTAAASNRPVVLLTLLNKPWLDKKDLKFFYNFSHGCIDEISWVFSPWRKTCLWKVIVCCDGGEVGLFERLFGANVRLTLGLPVGRPSAKYCGQDDDNPLSLSFIFLSRPFIDNLSWTPIKLHRYTSI